MIALAAKYKLLVHQMDVVTAYLNGSIEENIFMDIPDCLQEILEEIVVRNDGIGDSVVSKAREFLDSLKSGERKVCQIRRALYGLKQAGRQWNKRLDQELKRLNFKPLRTDPCLYH